MECKYCTAVEKLQETLDELLIEATGDRRALIEDLIDLLRDLDVWEVKPKW